MKRKTPHFKLFSVVTGALVFLLFGLLVAVSVILMPWINFNEQAQQVIASCEQVQSTACTKALFMSQKKLAQFASFARVLRILPVLNEIPAILSSHADVLNAAATLQTCFVDCTDTDLDTLARETHFVLAKANSTVSGSRLWNLLASKSSKLTTYHHALQSLYGVSDLLQPLFPYLPELLGQDKPITYRILLQNNKEIRPSGGFMGSYVNLTLKQAKITALKVEDVYVPDGQIKGYVQEPYGIKNYLFNGEHPGWRLRDSNWHPDFPTAAQSINWFFAEGQEIPADVLVAINLSTVEKIMNILGPIEVLDYDLSVDSASIYAITQAQSEHNFFPGSTQKGDFLRALNQAFTKQFLAVSFQKKLEIALLLFKELNYGEILFYAQNPFLQQEFVDRGFSGKLPELECETDVCAPNVLGIIEANVGSTKANCCITRDFDNLITVDAKEITQKISLTFTNSSLPEPEPPYHFGGGYKNYVRLVVPKDTTISSLAIDGKLHANNSIDSESYKNYTFFGFLHLIEGGTTSTATIVLKQPRPHAKFPATLTLLKQPGISEVPWTIRLLSANGEARQSLTLAKTTTVTF